MEFGKHYCTISAQNIALSLGYKKASALPLFHAVTGCDTTSAFAGRGKNLHIPFTKSFYHAYLASDVLEYST